MDAIPCTYIHEESFKITRSRWDAARTNRIYIISGDLSEEQKALVVAELGRLDEAQRGAAMSMLDNIHQFIIATDGGGKKKLYVKKAGDMTIRAVEFVDGKAVPRVYVRTSSIPYAIHQVANLSMSAKQICQKYLRGRTCSGYLKFKNSQVATAIDFAICGMPLLAAAEAVIIGLVREIVAPTSLEDVKAWIAARKDYHLIYISVADGEVNVYARDHKNTELTRDAARLERPCNSNGIIS